MKQLLIHFLHSLIDWAFRRRSVGATLIKLGLPLFALVLASLTIGVTVPTERGPLILSRDASGGGSAAPSWDMFAVAVFLILLGAALIIRDVRREDRGKVIVIEARGLRDWKGQRWKRMFLLR